MFTYQSHKLKIFQVLNIKRACMHCQIKAMSAVPPYLKFFSRSMTTRLRVLLGIHLCCSCTHEVRLGPETKLPFLSSCIRKHVIQTLWNVFTGCKIAWKLMRSLQCDRILTGSRWFFFGYITRNSQKSLSLISGEILLKSLPIEKNMQTEKIQKVNMGNSFYEIRKKPLSSLPMS